MEIALYLLIGLLMGSIGGLIGIGGSVIFIPLMVVFFGEDQHLYQASAMICNFAVSSAAVFAHIRAKTIIPQVLKWLIPLAIVGVFGGVMLSNSPLFQKENDVWLTRCFGAYMLYAAAYNIIRIIRKRKSSADTGQDQWMSNVTPVRCSMVGLISGTAAGLLGIGAGTFTTPLQQLTMHIPIRRCMSNAAALTIAVALVGSVFKNLTLPMHGIAITESLEIAACVVPTAFIGGYFGGHLMHKLPQPIIRGLFIIILLAGAVKLLTVQSS